MVGSAFELGYDVILENMQQAAEGSDAHMGAETFRWARGHLPAVNLWYAKLAIDQAVLNDMQEFLSPGYLDRVRQRAEKNWGSTYWWATAGNRRAIQRGARRVRIGRRIWPQRLGGNDGTIGRV